VQTFADVSKRNGHLAASWPTKPMHQGIQASLLQTAEIYLLPEINMAFVLGLSTVEHCHFHHFIRQRANNVKLV
jgi:hypothetical protein